MPVEQVTGRAQEYQSAARQGPTYINCTFESTYVQAPVDAKKDAHLDPFELASWRKTSTEMDVKSLGKSLIRER